jgi:hypothetical protein
MKKVVVRSVVIAAILTAAIAILLWYWTMKRELPAQARVIPADAIAVLTFNLRELAIDRSSDEHLFPEMADQALIEQELEPFTRAIAGNGEETGVAEMADILMFVYNTADAAYFGITVELDDSAAFGNLMRVHVAKEYNIVPLSMGGIPIMQFDTTAAVFGWTEDAALLLYPLGNHSIAMITAQCAKLLKQQKENSVLANEKFRDMEMQTFAMGLWVQTKPLLTFTGGGSLIEAIAHDVETYSYFANFEDGEILVRSEWHLPDEAKRAMIKEFEFPCDTSLIVGFIRGHFDVNTKSEPDIVSGDAAFDKLPFAEEDYAELFAGLTGDFISISHVNYGRVLPFETHSFLLSDPAKTNSFVTSRMQRDSIPLTVKGWTYTAAGDSTWRMIIDGNRLTLTNHAEVDGTAHGITPNLAGYMAWINVHNFSYSNGGISLSISIVKTGTPELAEHVLDCSSTLPVQFGDVRHSEIVFRFKNKDVNGLVQAEELLRKIYFGK